MVPICRKCGNPIAFKTLASGKKCPTNPDGSDHWDLCKGVDRTFAQAVRRCIAEGATKTHMRGQDYIYTGDVPPWDESLGPYRDFTRQETGEGKVCRRLTFEDRAPTVFTEAQLAQRWREVEEIIPQS